MKYFTLLFVFFLSNTCFSQAKKIQILNSEQTYKNETDYPGAIILNGNVKVSHKGIVLNCNKALYYRKKNLLHAYGNILINQGDTIKQKSDYTHYNGNTSKIVSWGKVVLTDPNITLKTDTLHFDRVSQELYYNCYATIKDDKNQLRSKNGTYFTEQKKFSATKQVVIENSEDKMVSNHVDYFTENKQVYFYGPSTITTKESISFAEKGFYDTENKISKLIYNSKIKYDNRTIEGDLIYSDKNKEFTSSTGNIIITDSINNSIIKGGHAEFYKLHDSVIVVDKPVAISIVEKDSMFIHGDTLLITGKKKERIIRAYHHVKIFKTDLRGKCDSLYSDQKSGFTKLFSKPVLWFGENQITGDHIQLLSDTKTSMLDSLFIEKNAFIIQKDSAGFNQIKGKNMFGKFKENKLHSLLTKGNGEVINYVRDEEKNLIAILKMTCSNILFELSKNSIDSIRFLKNPEGKTYPPSQFPEEKRTLKGFLWRGAEKPLKKDDIFIHDKQMQSSIVF